MSSEQVKAIEAEIRRAKKTVEVGEALERLRGNRDFRKVFIEGYFEQEAIRLVHLKSDPAFQTPERQAAIVNEIDGIGAAVQFCETVLFRAKQAQSAIVSSEQAIEEIAAEELLND